MDMTEAFVPSQAGGATGAEEKTTDFFDFVVSPAAHAQDDDDSFLQRATANCRSTIHFLNESRLHDGFIKETNNNTLTALPPVSTITGSLGHIAHHNQRNRCALAADDALVPMDQSDYWVSDDAKEQTCSILLEDLNKYCWSTQPAANEHHSASGLLHQRTRVSPALNDALQQVQQQQAQQAQQQQQRQQEAEDRQNTDGAIYTLTVLNSEASSMDGLEGCCKSPGGGAVGAGPDSWRPTNHLDLDAILNMESSVSLGADAGGEGSSEAGGMVAPAGSGFDERAAAFAVQVKAEVGDNNNDWKLSDRNSLQDSSESSAESLLRNALQGKLYPGAARVITASELQAATLQQVKDEPQLQPDELLLSQLDVDGAYRGDYEKLKSIANEVVESYCNLEPAVCSPLQPGTTVMYTLDPASGSLGTITLPADLAQVGTVTVVTTAPPPPPQQPQDPLLQDTRHSEQQAQTATVQQSSPTQLQIATSGGGGRAAGSKPAKKYVRRSKANGGAQANGAGSAGSGANSSSSGAGSPSSGGGGGGSGAATTQRKERSLHYCSICSKGFKDKYSVNVHIRTHTGEKPFSCSLCGKSFRQKAHLAKHYQTHVTQKPSSVAAQAAQAAAAAQAQANAQANGQATPPSPGASVEQVVQAVAADSQIAS